MEIKAPSLEDVRSRIDAVDDALVRLLAERAALAEEVRNAKRAEAGAAPSSFGLKPAREAQILRRLITAASGSALRDELLVRVWRELMSDSLARQGPFALAVCDGRSAARLVELARARFGASPALQLLPGPEATLRAARRAGTVAVLPLEGGAAGWGRILAEPGLAVFATLPCFARRGPPAALGIAALAPEPSGLDQTLWVTDAGGPAARIEEQLGALGLAGDLLAGDGALRLFALAGFLQADDPRLAGAPGRLKGVIGSAPLPFDL